MKDTTQARIDAMVERIYRIANFAPEARGQSLTDMDQAGLAETREAIRLLVLEQDRDTRHALLAQFFLTHVSVHERFNGQGFS